jgi:hypothetical protein
VLLYPISRLGFYRTWRLGAAGNQTATANPRQHQTEHSEFHD